jgi:hypothetical protein
MPMLVRSVSKLSLNTIEFQASSNLYLSLSKPDTQ